MAIPPVMRNAKLERAFYLRDALHVSRELLGKVLVSHIGGKTTAGRITETEAYLGVRDRASHAYGGRRTARTEVMYRAGGTAYVYLCYGIHSLFNVVVYRKGDPQAVLIRSIEPLEGIGHMLARRNLKNAAAGFTTGPGKVTQAMGIHYSHSGISLLGSSIWIEDARSPARSAIVASPRIGVEYAGSDALLPYRFILKN